jgi:VWFA-related protein
MRNRLLICLLGVASLAGILYAQDPPSNNVPQDRQTRGNTQIITTVVDVPLMVSVADNKGKLITNLTRNDFKVFEDDKPQTIKSFTRDTDLPLSIALLIDASGSVIEQLKFERAAATDFFFNTVKRKKDRAAVIAFDSVISILSNATADGFYDDPERLADAVKKIKAGGGTAVYDAVYGSVLKMLSKETGERRKLIILISDGDDTASKLSQTESIEMAQRHDVTIYAISTNRTQDTKSREKTQGDAVIQKMVDETGGKAYFPLKLDDLAVDFQKIGEELRSQYVIAYTPTNANLDGTYREVRVEMADKKYKARTRRGYFASKAN